MITNQRYRQRLLLDYIQSSYWFTTGLIVLGSMALVVVIQLIDRKVDVRELGLFAWLPEIGPEGARSVLSTIAGSTITVAGVIFSITIVALTMASGQFGPRLLRNFMKSGYTQWALGIFIGCFVYALLTLTRIPSPPLERPVPFLSVAVGVALGIVSFLVLIYYIHRTAQMLRAPQVIDRVGREAVATFERVFSADAAPQRTDTVDGEHQGPVRGRSIQAAGSGYIQAIEVEQLMAKACAGKCVIEMHAKVGQHVIHGQRIASVRTEGGSNDEDLAGSVIAAVTLGPERTSAQDAEFAIDQLVEIAVRSLSPGINDPFTAIHCIDQLGAVLAVLNRRHPPPARKYDDQGRLRLILQTDTYESIVDSAFDQIRHHASGHPAVLMRLLETICTLAGLARRQDLKRELRRQAAVIFESGLETLVHPADREGFRARYDEALSALEARPGDDTVLHPGG